MVCCLAKIVRSLSSDLGVENVKHPAVSISSTPTPLLHRVYFDRYEKLL